MFFAYDTALNEQQSTKAKPTHSVYSNHRLDIHTVIRQARREWSSNSTKRPVKDTETTAGERMRTDDVSTSQMLYGTTQSKTSGCK